MQQNRIELMSPAGNFECLQAAIDAGADSVYFGVEQLNMRARASMNFSLTDLPEIAAVCRKHCVRSYLTLNTIIYDHDLSLVKKMIDAAQQAGINAVIASDQAVIGYAHTCGMEVHISTQLNICNLETVRFYAHFADVMVLSRELSLGQIRSICEGIRKESITGPSGKLVEIEVFAHGALCMAVSGKCYISLHTQNASANRGACTQNCRRRYQVTDLEDGHVLEIDNEYIMSPKDLCSINFLDELIGTGVQVLKLEGRGKGPDYVHTVTRCYREAIDHYYAGSYSPEKAAEWMKQMETVFNRGFWGGYYTGQKLGEWTNAHGSKASTRKLYIGRGNHYYPKKGIAEFCIEAYPLEVGDRVMITGKHIGYLETTISSLHINNSGTGNKAEKGDTCSFPLNVPVHKSDKLYKIMDNSTLEKA